MREFGGITGREADIRGRDRLEELGKDERTEFACHASEDDFGWGVCSALSCQVGPDTVGRQARGYLPTSWCA